MSTTSGAWSTASMAAEYAATARRYTLRLVTPRFARSIRPAGSRPAPPRSVSLRPMSYRLLSAGRAEGPVHQGDHRQRREGQDHGHRRAERPVPRREELVLDDVADQ